jgi:membrane protein implicated in regulation of membrane protease activity
MWIWLIVALALLGIEMLTGTLALLFAGLGGLAAAAIAWLLPDSFAWQITVFALASLAGLIVAVQRRRQRGEADAPADGTESAGRIAQVVSEPDLGGVLRVRYRGSEWPAVMMGHQERENGMALAPGSHVRIVGQDGSTLQVAFAPS